MSVCYKIFAVVCNYPNGRSSACPKYSLSC